MTNCLRRGVVLLLAGLSLAFPLAAGSKETWVEVQSPNFTVISNAGEKEARKIAEQFEQFRGVVHNFMPLLRMDLGKPLVIFAVKNEESLKALLPAPWEVKGHLHPAGVYVPGEERHFVALRTDIAGQNPYVVVYHEYTHAIMNLNSRELPLWLNEGLADFLANSTIEDKWVIVGKIAPYHLRVLEEHKFIPIQTLLEADYKSPYYNEQNRASVFYAESWAITHYLMMDPEAKQQKLLETFLKSWDSSGNQLEAAQKAFGDLHQFAQAMEAYVRRGDFYYSKISSPPHGDPKSYPSRMLSPAEIAAERGMFYLHTQRPEEATSALQEAAQEGQDLPLAHEGLGMLALSQQHNHAAEVEFARAIELKSTDYFAYYFHAQAQMRQGIRSAGDQAEVMAALEKTVALNPQFAPAYAMLSSYYADDPDSREKAIAFGAKAMELEPGNLSYAIGLAYVFLNAGKLGDAQYLAREIRAAAKTPSDRDGADELARTVARRVAAEQARAAAEAKAKEEQRRAVELEAAKPTAAPPSAPGGVNAANASPAPSGKPDQPQGQEYGVEGIISSAECNTTAGGRVTLSVNKTAMKFHYSDMSKLQVVDSTSTDAEKTPDCTEWKGRRARLYFYKTKNREFAGELATIQFF